MTLRVPEVSAFKAHVSLSQPLREQFPEVAKALKYICAGKESKWSMPRNGAAASGAGAKHFQTLGELVDWFLPLRTVRAARDPKVRALDGQPMPV